MVRPYIALWGSSGSGKTTVAKYLEERHGYVHCSAGTICRRICRELFSSESKTLLNKVNDAMRSIDPHVWIQNATKNVPDGCPIVFDSIRFNEDWRYFQERGFQFWRIECPYEIRLRRLHDRGQEFRPGVDDQHRGEIELANRTFNVVLQNKSTTSDLYLAIENALSQI